MKLVKENLNGGLELTPSEYETIFNKLEYTFKKSNNPIVDKIAKKQVLTDGELETLLKKFEYTYRKTGSPIIDKIKEHLGLSDLSNVKYSNIKAKQLKDIRNKE